MLRAIFFDLGGVLVRTEDREPRRSWERRFGLPEWGLAKIVFDNPVSRQASLGRASVADVWAEVARQLSLSPDEIKALRDDFFRGDVWDADLLGLIRALRPRFKTGVISNAWPDVRQMTQSHVNSDTFDVILFSAEEGVEKPDPEIYRRALARLQIADPAEAAFVDDTLANVEGARALGMHGIHFTDPARAREELHRLMGDHD
jgi:HAD superfamily hydrolase (TIGR01509 family)